MHENDAAVGEVLLGLVEAVDESDLALAAGTAAGLVATEKET